MEEALFLQRRQELRRDLQLQRLLLQEQLDQQNALGAPASTASGLGSRSIYELPYGAAGLAAQYEQELLLQQEHIRRRQLVQAAMNAERDAATEAIADAVRRRTSSNADLGASAALTAQKRSFDQQEAESPPRKRPAKSEVGAGKHSSSPEKETSKSGSSASKSKASEKPAKSKSRVKRKSSVSKPKPSKRRNSSSKTPTPLLSRADSEESGDKMRDALEALAAVGSDLPPQPIQSEIVFAKGTIENLLAAAKTEEKADAVVETIAKLKSSVVWEESEDEQDEAETVEIRGFQSSLPRLPREPEYRFKFNGKSNKSNGMKSVCASPSANKDKSKDSRSVLSMTVDYPYPVDTWWPSVSSVRKERRNKGEESDEEDVTEAVIVDGKETLYRANLSSVRKRLANAVEPGVLEKLPHCRVHRMFMKHKRVANVPDHAFCWQVSENYCNHPLVCCSVCSTWRHAACGGHHKPFTVKDMTEQPFVAICDRCHVEKDILKDYPKAQERLERQRVEHIRRGLATSAVIRQAAFAKHGGTYKWPLGSVSTTHIGGHIRSVHSRHDKAEKQWSEMVTRLSKGYASRPKERAKVRTRELERLLAHVEDAGKSDLMFLFCRTSCDACSYLIKLFRRGSNGPTQYDAVSAARRGSPTPRWL